MTNPISISVKDGNGSSQTVSTLDALINGASPTDRSGTVTAGGAQQTLMASNANRRGLWVQNQSTGDLWISELGNAAATEPSAWLPAGTFYERLGNSVPTAAISIFGATTGQAFAAREW